MTLRQFEKTVTERFLDVFNISSLKVFDIAPLTRPNVCPPDQEITHSSLVLPLPITALDMAEIYTHLDRWLPAMRVDLDQAKYVALSNTTKNLALCWIADELGKEVLVNGIRRGTLPKNRSSPSLR